MLQQQSLGVEEAQRAVAVVLAEAQRDGRPMAVAVVDNHGDLICCLRMDGAAARIGRHAIRKAYTAATMQRDTLTFKKDLREREGNLAEWGDPRLTTLQGGAIVVYDGQVVGAVGVGGNVRERDEAIAHLAVQAILEAAGGAP